MDTKLKNNNPCIKLLLISIIFIILFSISLPYSKIKKLAEKYQFNVYEERHTSFVVDIPKLNYYLYYELLKGNNEGINPSDIFIKDININDNLYNKEKQLYLFDDNIKQIQYILRNYLNLEYYILDKETSNYKTNSDISKITSNDDKIIKENYRFYMTLEYDNNGNIIIEKVYGADKSRILQLVNLYNNKENTLSLDESYFNDLNIKFNDIKNTKYIYAVPLKLTEKDKIYNKEFYMKKDAYFMVINLFNFICGAIIALICLIVPYSKIKDTKLFNFTFRFSLEFNILFFILSLGYLIGILPAIIYEVLESTFYLKDNLLVRFINGISFSIAFILLFILFFNIKHIFKIGILNFIKTKSLVYKGLNKLFDIILRNFKSIFKFFRNIDITERNNKKIILILSLNLILISIMCSMWFFGIVLAIIYTIILTYFVLKKYNKFSDDYNKVLNLTNQISNGNLDIYLDNDISIFKNLENEIINIKQGLKKAIDEEIKSEKMKTELISNVSHDLKTPLTSIITYIELLKEKNLTEENRNQYINILDKKSQRLQKLIEDLFEVSKANSGNITLNLEQVDIIQLIKQTLLELDDKIIEKDLIIKTNFSKEKIILNLDSERIFRVFENLVINITKYAMPKTRVYIDILDIDNAIQISFKNITQEEINFNTNELTERFVRGDKSRNSEGSGLGLAIAKSFINLHNGKLDLIVDGDLFKVVITFNK